MEDAPEVVEILVPEREVETEVLADPLEDRHGAAGSAEFRSGIAGHHEVRDEHEGPGRPEGDDTLYRAANQVGGHPEIIALGIYPPGLGAGE